MLSVICQVTIWRTERSNDAILQQQKKNLISQTTALAILAVMLASAFPARSQTPVTLFQNVVGHVNFEVTGGSLRTEPNTGNSCAVGPSSTSPLANVPASATILNAYLYWAGSGSTVDSSVTLNGNTVAAGRTFTATFNAFNTNFDFFSGFADVTAFVAGNGNYSFSGLSVNTGAPHCGSSAVLAGWSLVVVYEDASEDLRAVNIFDGFQFFRGNSIGLTIDTFRIPPSPINGKLAVITWEGDPQNSGSLNGFSESLTINGNVLDDGIVPPASSPTVQQFDGTINGIGVANSHGVDVDTYDISPFLSPGDTSASMGYSSGGDLVLLTAQIVSVTTEPVVDLGVRKSHSGSFTVGNNHDYLIQVSNNGPEAEPNPIQVDDTLPNGLSFVSAAGTGWSCGSSGQDVSCTHPGPLAVGTNLPDLTITVAVAPAAVPSVDNIATVSSASVDTTGANDSSTDTTLVLGPDLSTSTKTVVDLNGGDANPGDTLRYTITLNETAGTAAANVTVSDDMPGNVDNFSVFSIPAGASDNSTGAGTGANGTGFLDVGGITVPAGGSVAILFDVTVAAGANPGDIVSNVAAVNNPNGASANPLAPDVIVSQSQIPGSGTKPLYLYDLTTPDPNGANTGPQPYLSRTPPAGLQSNVIVDRFQPPVVWSLTPALQAPLTLGAGSIPVTLWISKGGSSASFVQRQLTVSLNSIGGTTGPIGGPVVLTFAAPPNTAPAQFVFNIPLPADMMLTAGSQITLSVQNTTPGGGSGTRRTRVFPVSGGNNSRVDLNSLTVINVDSVESYDGAFPGGTPVAQFAPGGTAFIRAVVSDPFGSFDINPLTQPALDILDPTGTPVVSAQVMSEVADSGADTKTFELLYAIPPAAPAGNWTMRVLATEGTEGTVTDSGVGVFQVSPLNPNLLVLKSVQTVSDPVNNLLNPKAIPGAVVMYSITLTNQGQGTVDANSLIISDVIPANTSLFVDTGSGDPIAFVNGGVASGLSYDFSNDVSFSNQPGGGAPYSYTPVPDTDGFDANATGISVNPTGTMNGASGGNNPSFTIRFRVRVE